MRQPHLPAQASIESTVLPAVAAAYGFDVMPQASVRQGGAINHVVLVAAGDRDVIVRVHQPGTTPERLEAVHRVQDALRDHGLPIPGVYRTRSGASWMRAGNRLVEVLSYVPGGREVESRRDGCTVAATLGQLHAVLRTIDGSRLPSPVHACYAEPDLQMELLAATRAAFPALAHEPGYATALEIQHVTADLLVRLHDAWRSTAGCLSGMLVHGDFVGNNVLLSGDQVVAILDFDRLAVRPRVYEIATTLMYILTRLVRTGQRIQASGGALTGADLTYAGHLLRAYTRASGWSLTLGEMQALPFEMARTPLYPIVAAGDDLKPERILETLDFGSHLPLCTWLVEHAGRVSETLAGEAC